MTRNTPPLGTMGRYELQDPWIAKSTKVYTCHAARTFRDLYVQGDDPDKLVYKPVGAGQALRAEDEAAGARIVTLIADDGETIYVPDTRIVSFPNQGFYVYRNFVLSFSTGPLPEGVSLDWLKTKVAEDVTEVLGVTPTVMVHSAPVRDAITPDEHQRIEAARAQAKTEQVTYKARYEQTNSQLQDLTEKYRQLEELCRKNGWDK